MKIFLFAGAAFAALAAAPAFSQPPQSGPGAPSGGPNGRMRTPDSRAEVQQMIQQRFAEADANHDGFVSQEEMQATGPGQAGQAGAAGAAGADAGRRGGRMFERADANHDGKLTLDELGGPFLARFDRVDANHDGTISPEEREAARAAMRARREARGEDAPPPPPPGEDPPQGE